MIRVTRLAAGTPAREQLAADVRAGLGSTPRSLPPKWFYDGVGSKLFEDITRLPEYYQTRAETAILEAVAADVVAAVQPAALLELGSGSSRKTRLLLEAMHAAGSGHTYVPFDVSEDALAAAGEALTASYPWLDVDGIVGDFDHHLGALPMRGRKLLAFLGGTIGNLEATAQVGFLATVADRMGPDDGFLVGMDLRPDGVAKTVDDLVAAYDDSAGVTAAFNRNVLHVVNRELGADFDPDAFAHVARYHAEYGRIEMWLRADRAMAVHVADLGLDVAFAAGEELLTEISCKFTREVAEQRLGLAGLRLARWDLDPSSRFALALARRR